VTAAPPPAPPAAVVALAEQRTRARTAKDFATSDALRERIRELGWVVTDSADGSVLSPAPPYDVAASPGDLPVATGAPTRRVTAALLVEGWPEDLRRCVEALLEHGPADLVVLGLDLGDVDGAGHGLHELAVEHPDRVEELHLAGRLGWGPARRALLAADPARVHLLIDPSSVLDGDAITPLVDALDAEGVVGAGWRGALVDTDDAWRQVTDAGPGEVDVLLGYLMALDREAARAADVPHPKARFYRNADLELSLALRAAGGRLVVPAADLPVHQERHRGYHDSDPAVRERESKRTYDRLLATYRGRTDILAPRRG
jgi:GT2 family glycosyltransferase